MSNISWVENLPSDTSRVADYPTFARAMFRAVTQGLATSLYWDASGGDSSASAGGLKPGGSRAFYAAQSASSVPSQGTARAFLCSDTSRFLVYDSAATWLGGTPFYEEFQSGPSAGGVMLMQSGSTSSNWNSVMTIAFPAPFGVAPRVMLTVQCVTPLEQNLYAALLNSGTTNFQSTMTTLGGVGTTSGATLHWTAIGSSTSYL